MISEMNKNAIDHPVMCISFQEMRWLTRCATRQNIWECISSAKRCCGCNLDMSSIHRKFTTFYWKLWWNLLKRSKWSRSCLRSIKTHGVISNMWFIDRHEMDFMWCKSSNYWPVFRDNTLVTITYTAILIATTSGGFTNGTHGTLVPGLPGKLTFTCLSFLLNSYYSPIIIHSLVANLFCLSWFFACCQHFFEVGPPWKEM